MQMLFGPSDGTAKEGGFKICIRPGDFVVPMCHEGMNRSQVRARGGVCLYDGVSFVYEARRGAAPVRAHPVICARMPRKCCASSAFGAVLLSLPAAPVAQVLYLVMNGVKRVFKRLPARVAVCHGADSGFDPHRGAVVTSEETLFQFVHGVLLPRATAGEWVGISFSCFCRYGGVSCMACVRPARPLDVHCPLCGLKIASLRVCR